MIPFKDIIFMLDAVSQLSDLDEVIQFGIYELGARHENPDMITLIMDLAAREKKQLMGELTEEIAAFKAKHHPAVRT